MVIAFLGALWRGLGALALVIKGCFGLFRRARLDLLVRGVLWAYRTDFISGCLPPVFFPLLQVVPFVFVANGVWRN
jgi:hypothetical protein